MQEQSLDSNFVLTHYSKTKFRRFNGVNPLTAFWYASGFHSISNWDKMRSSLWCMPCALGLLSKAISQIHIWHRHSSTRSTVH